MQKKPRNNFYQYTGAAFKMIVIVVGMTLGGRWLDDSQQLSFPAFTLFGALAGSGIAIYSMIKDVSK